MGSNGTIRFTKPQFQFYVWLKLFQITKLGQWGRSLVQGVPVTDRADGLVFLPRQQ